MTFPVNKIIVSSTTIRPVDGVVPVGVSLVYRDPNGVDHSVAVTLEAQTKGTWTYRGFVLPTVTGNWTRTWSATSLLTEDVATLQVV